MSAMSIESPDSNWQPSDDLRDRLGGPINDAERMVYLSGSEHPHRVTWALRNETPNLRTALDEPRSTTRF